MAEVDDGASLDKGVSEETEQCGEPIYQGAELGLGAGKSYSSSSSGGYPFGQLGGNGLDMR